MPSSVDAKPGLGTGIVQALVSQLKAKISIADAAPGTAISISYVPAVPLGKPHHKQQPAEDQAGGREAL